MTGTDAANTAELDDAARYTRFREVIVGTDPVEVKAGPGGLSFYVRCGERRTFACHFNARPRRAETARGFADFKATETGLDAESLVADLEARLAGKADCRRGALWWSAQFAASEDAAVAGAFRAAVVVPLLATSDASDG